jgi:hypothetical protein
MAIVLNLMSCPVGEVMQASPLAAKPRGANWKSNACGFDAEHHQH